MLLKLRFMLLITEFLVDWYHTRNFSSATKQVKMDKVMVMRTLIQEAIEKEQG